MVGAKRLQQREPFALDIEAAVAIQQALLAFARDDRAKAKIAQVLLADGLGSGNHGFLMPPLEAALQQYTCCVRFERTRRTACVRAPG